MPKQGTGSDWEACTCGHSVVAHWWSKVSADGDIDAMPNDDLGAVSICRGKGCPCGAFAPAWKAS